ncbi:CDP-glycerol glycerophosphotransferase family protein [Arthrobacter sp. YD2]|uniref:bifunctional glycosyltransferase/CDP-glycerol:glycerophosphate glycerophosphotransferase n=1 Tax=Arthrobacter sp. YD2 TaxID=3058046 RepID=UPI0025B5DAD8|nr:CDP-glycerol glycerophosphotransferase family protein [Arthrobacter sp. YD2]MDN3904210.1 CDP-glycerol glycerophosphotransferase family protein [Arthrobacter sp. YD2]
MELLVAAAGGGRGEALRQAAGTDPRVRMVAPGKNGQLQACLRAAGGNVVVLVEPGARPDAGLYGGMVAALATSEAGFVSAAPRSTSGPGRPAALLQASGRTGLRLTDVPSAVADSALWNKAYRRTCLDRITADLPANASPMDIAVRGYLRADSFDYLGIPGGRGPKAPAASAARLGEDLAACIRIAPLLATEAAGECRGFWYAAGLGSRWRTYLRDVPRSGPEHWQLVRQAAALLTATSGGLDRFRLHDRVLAALAAAGDRAGIDIVLAELQDQGPGYRVLADDSAYYAVPTYRPLLNERVEPGMFRLHAADLQMRSLLRGFRWDGDVLELSGAAYVEGLDTRIYPALIRAELVDRSTDQRYPLTVLQCADSAIDEKAGDRFNTYAGAGFSIRLDTGDLLRSTEPGRGREWYVGISMDIGGIHIADRLQGRDEDLVPRRLPLGPAVGERRIAGLMDAVHGLRLAAVSYRFLVDDVRAEGETLRVHFAGAMPERVHLQLPDGGWAGCRRCPDQPGTFVVELAGIQTGPKARESIFPLRAGAGSGQFQYAGWTGTDEELESRRSADGFQLRTTGYGFLSVIRPAARAAVTGWTLCLSGERLSISGHWLDSHKDGTGEIVLAGPHELIRPQHVDTSENGHFLAEYDLRRDLWGAGKAWPESGTYRLVSQSGDGGTPGPVSVTAGLAQKLPMDASRSSVRVAAPASGTGEPFRLRILSPLGPEERGLYNRQRLVESYAATTAPLVSAVFFESFAGTSATDNVRAVCREIAARYPELRRYWSVADSSVIVPAGCTPLIRFSKEWFRMLATAQYLINNNTFPVFFRKRPGQIYAQTWHGTPLKRIGFDTPATRVTPSYRRTLEREPQSWDVLLAQSPYAAQTLASAFRYPGPVITAGYPRNDPLLHEDAPARRMAIRSSLGIPASSMVLLYAPTWRDTARTRGDKFAVVNHLDIPELGERLGRDYTFLFRGHHNVAAQRGTNTGGALDVTAYPEITDLYLAADLLVTDYSSVMFDFAVTGKPIYLLAPDLDEYRDVIRGFYFDVTAERPGPLASTSAELASHIASRLARGYPDFARRYAPLDDGQATSRFVDSIFGNRSR